MKKKMITVALCLAMFFGGQTVSAFSLAIMEKGEVSYYFEGVEAVTAASIFIGGWTVFYGWTIHQLDLTIRAMGLRNRTLANNETFLMRAITNGNNTLAHRLIPLGSNINVVDQNGETALVRSAQVGNTYIAKRLLSYGSDLYHVDSQGKTALEHAAANGHSDMVKLLYSKGACCRRKSEMIALGLSSTVQKLLLDEYSYSIKKKHDKRLLSLATALEEKGVLRDVRGVIFSLLHGEAIKESGLVEAIENQLLTPEILQERKQAMDAARAKSAGDEIGGLC